MSVDIFWQWKEKSNFEREMYRIYRLLHPCKFYPFLQWRSMASGYSWDYSSSMPRAWAAAGRTCSRSHWAGPRPWCRSSPGTAATACSARRARSTSAPQGSSSRPVNNDWQCLDAAARESCLWFSLTINNYLKQVIIAAASEHRQTLLAGLPSGSWWRRLRTPRSWRRAWGSPPSRPAPRRSPWRPQWFCTGWAAAASCSNSRNSRNKGKISVGRHATVRHCPVPTCWHSWCPRPGCRGWRWGTPTWAASTNFKDCFCTVSILITLVSPVPGGGRVDEVPRWADLLVAGALGEAAQLLGGQQPTQ